MQLKSQQFPFALVLLISTILPNGVFAKSKGKDAILLSSIKALTFRSGNPTTARRVSAIPQLKCVGGSGRGHFEPDTIRCTNSGSSYSASDIEWTCQASLPPEFKLGSTDVICEGYDSPQDDYVLKGSCGLEYRLVLTDMGEEKFGRSWYKQTDRATGGGVDGFLPTLFWIAFVAVLLWMVYTAFTGNRRGAGGQRRPIGYGGGGGGDDGRDDPPPPYSASKPRPSASSNRSGTRARGNNQQQQGWRPGFWTGLGTGAVARHFAGRAFGARQEDPRRRQQQYGGGWGGYGGDVGESSSMGRRSGGESSYSSPSTSETHSSSRYTSTGFGGTTRR